MENLFDDKNVQTVDSVKDWKEAIKKASMPLLEEGDITFEYVDNMIKSVEKNGPYMVLTDYFALMHARPGEGVNRKAMSLFVTKKPIDVKGKLVKIFLVMAATDNTSHLASLQEIMNIFMDKKSYKTILEGNKEQILKLFKERVKS